MDRCDACDLVYDEVALDDAIARIRDLPANYRDVLVPAETAGLARTRPEPSTWSALEYTCHVRDVFVFQRERLARALVEDRPAFVSMDREERVERERYNQQDVEVVLRALDDAVARFAETCSGVDGAQWERIGVYDWPSRGERTMAWLLRHTLHEGVHHLTDVGSVVDRVRPTPA